MKTIRSTLLFSVLCFLCVSLAQADTLIDRKYFTINLPSGWKIVKTEPMTANQNLEDEAHIEDMGVTVRFRRSTFSVVGGPITGDFTFEELCALHHPEPRTVIGRKEFSEFAGRKGIGKTLTIQHPFPVISVQSRFSFEKDGCMCTVTWSASAEKAEEAARDVERQRGDIENAVKRIVVRKRA